MPTFMICLPNSFGLICLAPCILAWGTRPCRDRPNVQFGEKKTSRLVVRLSASKRSSVVNLHDPFGPEEHRLRLGMPGSGAQLRRAGPGCGV